MPCDGSIHISFPHGLKDAVRIAVSGSKSQSNRLLLLRAVTGASFSLENLSDSDDTRAMASVLDSTDSVVDIGHAGTAMRFGTAFLAARPGREVTLTGSSRMKERPIAPLVEALRSLGADIRYGEKEGYPPLEIRGKKLTGGDCSIDSSVSSQFITALMLVAPSFEKGMRLHLEGKSVSRPYIELTASVLRSVGLDCTVGEKEIVVPPGLRTAADRVTVESDWSSASYYFSMAAIGRKKIAVSSYFPHSAQGDSRLTEIYRNFGVEARFQGNELLLEPVEGFVAPGHIDLDMENTPDVAQSVAVTMAALQIKGTLTGLGTLRVKETDRIAALSGELAKFGVGCSSTADTLTIESFSSRRADICLETYQDHRMAMAFAPLALGGSFAVCDPGVVAKSYPRFWDDLQTLGLFIAR